MKRFSQILLFFVCLISLANCRRGGPMMGGGPMEGAGPCDRCNNPRRGLANNDLIRERPQGNIPAPFPSFNAPNNQDSLGDLNIGQNDVIPEDLNVNEDVQLAPTSLHTHGTSNSSH